MAYSRKGSKSRSGSGRKRQSQTRNGRKKTRKSQMGGHMSWSGKGNRDQQGSRKSPSQYSQSA